MRRREEKRGEEKRGEERRREEKRGEESRRECTQLLLEILDFHAIKFPDLIWCNTDRL